MGHATAIIELDSSELPANPTSRSIMDAAVGKWQEEEAERWSDTRHSYPELSPIASEQAASNFIDDGESIGDGKSRIIPLTTDYSEKSSTVRLRVSAKELSALRRGHYWNLLRAGRFGTNVASVEIAALPKPRAPRAEATVGKATTLYKIVDGNHYPVRALKSSYASQAEARAAAVRHMEENPACSELAVEAFVQRDTGSAALVRITRPEPEAATVSFKVTTQTPKPKAAITGYLVAFDYHH